MTYTDHARVKESIIIKWHNNVSAEPLKQNHRLYRHYFFPHYHDQYGWQIKLPQQLTQFHPIISLHHQVIPSHNAMSGLPQYWPSEDYEDLIVAEGSLMCRVGGGLDCGGQYPGGHYGGRGTLLSTQKCCIYSHTLWESCEIVIKELIWQHW